MKIYGLFFVIIGMAIVMLAVFLMFTPLSLALGTTYNFTFTGGSNEGFSTYYGRYSAAVFTGENYTDNKVSSTNMITKNLPGVNCDYNITLTAYTRLSPLLVGFDNKATYSGSYNRQRDLLQFDNDSVFFLDDNGTIVCSESFTNDRQYNARIERQTNGTMKFYKDSTLIKSCYMGDCYATDSYFTLGVGGWNGNIDNVAFSHGLQSETSRVSIFGPVLVAGNGAGVIFDEEVSASSFTVAPDSVYIRGYNATTPVYGQTGGYGVILNINHTTPGLVNTSDFIDYVRVYDTYLGSYVENYTLGGMTASGKYLRFIFNRFSDDAANNLTFSGGGLADNLLFSINYQELDNLTLNLTTDSLLNVTFVDSYNGSSIGLFNATIPGVQKNTSKGYVEFRVQKGSSYLLTASNPSYITASQTVTPDARVYNLTLSSYTAESIFITLRDEETKALITPDNISIVLQGGDYLYNFTTNTGKLYKYGLSSDLYNIKISGGNYTTKYYALNITPGSTSTLTAYLREDYESSVFTIKDKTSNENLKGALMSMSRLINGSWQYVSSKYSDVAGNIPVSYKEDAAYKFIVTKGGYKTKTFTLDPVMYSTYNVYLESSGGSSLNPQSVSVSHSPKSFTNGSNTLNVTFEAVSGELERYWVNITYPGGSSYTEGSDTLGESLGLSFSMTNPSMYDTVGLTLYYLMTDGTNRTMQYTYPVETRGVGTFSKNPEIVNGMGWLGQILIATIATIAAAGAAYMVGGSSAALILGLLAMAFFSIIGYYPVAVGFISFIVGIFVVIDMFRRS